MTDCRKKEMGCKPLVSKGMTPEQALLKVLDTPPLKKARKKPGKKKA